ncbi:hypothetical protein [Levilactobacillus namurensis]|uniref:hypothetical protein n=1 Tax=Levilactobacillus namurensis TaxID=380393 RepID=UPI001D9E9BA8|nr:hypothetical protein [Levilactobacillus namurensis]HJE45637.1 hypothetical protein [Levilactobacillus namurensis]
MQQIIFLVTSLEGLHKPNFTKQLKQAAQYQVPLKVLVALVDFEQNWAVRQFIQRLGQEDARLANIEVVTLADMVAEMPGLALTDQERGAVDLSGYDQRLFADQKEQVKRYLKDGHLVAELRQENDETPMALRLYQEDQVAQIETFGPQGNVVGVTHLEGGVPTTSYLLNNQGQAALRFVRHQRMIEHVYNLGSTSALSETAFSNAKQAVIDAHMTHRQRTRAEAANGIDHTEVINAPETYYGVLVYATYHRFTDVFAYYQTVLDRVMTTETRLYIDLAVNPIMSARMPHQLIFNY